MGCIETQKVTPIALMTHQINFNMGCIETRSSTSHGHFRNRLTLTWDVLKLLYHRPVLFHFWINFNMGCIETYHAVSGAIVPAEINFNMGCIGTNLLQT